MARIPEHIIDRIRTSVDIVGVISRYVSLKKAGRNYKGLCPFHTEKTPSFIVSPEKQIYHCFGCGAGGNVFNFLMQYEKISFYEALKLLAEEAGIQLPKTRESREQMSEYDRLYEINQFAAEVYHRLLQQNYPELQAYFTERGISAETIKLLKLGYAPRDWDTLLKTAQNARKDLRLLLKVGLLTYSDKNPERKYDRFRQRLIFPIFNVSGRVVAFGGRDLSGQPETPKYINSPESPIYNKSEVLFGLHLSKDWIRQEGFAIFVEGYMDFLQLFQQGIKNVVATSGTALTEQHSALIRRYTQRIILCYDSDSAGVTAALRGGQILFQNNLDVQVLLLPEGEDPDSFVKKHGAAAFLTLLKSAHDYFDFKTGYLLKQAGGESVTDQSAVVNSLLESLAPHSDPVKQNFYLNRLAEQFNLQVDMLAGELKRKKRFLRRPEKRVGSDQNQKISASASTLAFKGAWSAEKDTIVLLLNHYSELKSLIFDILEPDDFQNESFRNIFKLIAENREIENQEDLLHLILPQIEDTRILDMITGELLEQIVQPDKYLDDCIQKIKIARYQEQMAFYKEKLKTLRPDQPEYQEALLKINESIQEINKIRRIFNEEQ